MPFSRLTIIPPNVLRNRRCRRVPAAAAHSISLWRRILTLVLLPALLLTTPGLIRPGAALAAPAGARLPTVQTPKVDWTPVYYKGRSYVPLNQVAAYYNFRSPEIWSKTFTLRSKDFSVEITQGEKQIRLNGWTFFCSFPVLKQQNIPLMSVFDVRNVLDPILRPTDRRDPTILRTVIIDPSGGGKDKGIEASGVVEKELTLDMARILAVLLKNNGYKVILTRSEDKVVLPAARVKIANEVQEEAIYLNLRAASSPSALKGFECSTLPPAGTPATNEADSPNIDKRFFPGNIGDRESLALATVVQNSAVSKTGTTDLGVRRVRVEELRDLGMPAISCKLGYLSSKTEAAKLATKEYRLQLASAMVEGIGRYADFLRRNMAERTEEDRVRPLKFGPVTVKQEVGVSQTTTTVTNPDREQARHAATLPLPEAAPAGPAPEAPADAEAEASPAPDTTAAPLPDGESSNPPAPANSGGSDKSGGSGESSSAPAPENSGAPPTVSLPPTPGPARTEAKSVSSGWFGIILPRLEQLQAQANAQAKPEQNSPGTAPPPPAADPSASPSAPVPPVSSTPAPSVEAPPSGAGDAAPPASTPDSSAKSPEPPAPSPAPGTTPNAAAPAEAPATPPESSSEKKSEPVPSSTRPDSPAAEGDQPQPTPEEKPAPTAPDPEKTKPSSKKPASGGKTKASSKSSSSSTKSKSKSAARNRSPEDETGDDWGKKAPAKKSSKTKPSSDKPAPKPSDKPAPDKPAPAAPAPVSAGDRVTLRLPIVASGPATIDRSQVELQIFLFESVNNGEIDLTTSNPPETRWLSVLPDWKAGVPEWFQAIYLRPPFNTQEEKQYGKRAYYGYVARLIYAGRVMDETCYPPNLNRCLYYFTPVFPRR